MPSYRVAVTGGRNYDDEYTVNKVLDAYSPSIIAQGGASGADRLAALWAHAHSRACVTYAADWAMLGKRAGPIRNRKMLVDFKPDFLIAFPGGRGTANCVTQAESLGIEIVKIQPSHFD